MKQSLSRGLLGIVIFGYSSLLFGGTVYYVDNSALGNNDGSSWCNAFTELRDAINPSINTTLTAGDEIWVADGTYYPASSGSPGTSFQLIPGVAIYGGFDGVSTPAATGCVEDGETVREQRDSNPMTNGRYSVEILTKTTPPPSLARTLRQSLRGQHLRIRPPLLMDSRWRGQHHMRSSASVVVSQISNLHTRTFGSQGTNQRLTVPGLTIKRRRGRHLRTADSSPI